MMAIRKTFKIGKGKSAKTFRKGALHRALGVPEGQKIPASKKAAALRSKNPRVRKMATAAFRGILAAGRKTVARRRRSIKNVNSPSKLYAIGERRGARARKRRGG